MTQNKSHTVKPRQSRRSPRTQFNSKRGAPVGNQNACKLLMWQDNYDLSGTNGIRGFLEEVIRAVWEGRLGTRAASSLNGSLRLMFELCELPDLEKRIAELEKTKQH